MQETEKTRRALIARGVLIMLGLALSLCGLSAFGLWYLIRPLPLGAVRVWAILATLALPVVAFGSWVFGRREANVKMDGLTTGVNEVMAAAERTASIKDRSAKKARQDVKIAVLPQLQGPGVVHRELTDGEGKVVDL